MKLDRNWTTSNKIINLLFELQAIIATNRLIYSRNTSNWRGLTLYNAALEENYQHVGGKLYKLIAKVLCLNCVEANHGNKADGVV